MTHPTPVKPETSGDAPDFENIALKLSLSISSEQHIHDDQVAISSRGLEIISDALQSSYQLGIEAGRKQTEQS